MAKQPYYCSKCGKLAGKATGFNRRDAEQKAAWFERRGAVCEDCQRIVWQEKNQKALADSAAAGLPDLTGSEKQCAWAAKIRLPILSKLDDEAAKIVKYLRTKPFLSEAAHAEVADAVALITSEIRNQTDASWWIDNRDKDAEILVARAWLDRSRNLAPTLHAELRAHKAAQKAQAQQERG